MPSLTPTFAANSAAGDPPFLDFSTVCCHLLPTMLAIDASASWRPIERDAALPGNTGPSDGYGGSAQRGMMLSVKLKSGTIFKLAEMICGQTGTEPERFPYRTMSEIERFFINCDIEGSFSGSRHPTVRDLLDRINLESDGSALPGHKAVRVLQELLDPTNFARLGMDVNAALDELNVVLRREGLEAFLDGAGTCQLRAGTATTVGARAPTPGFTKRELELRTEWERYLESASEDEFTEAVLVPLLLHLGFQRVSSAGHEDKALEYGKDLWMKLQLPTSHWVYFAIQVKKGKLDSAGRSKAEHANISEVLNQVRMALDSDVWDPDLNKTVLVDHVYVVASGAITKAAKKLLGERLDRDSRRHIIFMDQEDILNLAAKTNLAQPWKRAL